MTEKLKKQLIFGLLAWGLFAFLPNTAHAQIINWSAGSVKDLAEEVSAQAIRSQGQAGVDKAMESAGYSSSNVRAVTSEEIAAKEQEADQINTRKEHLTGATNAAVARWKGSQNALTGAWNVVTGAAADLFRTSDQIEESLQDYLTADNADNIAAATKAAAALDKQNDDRETAQKAVAVYETTDGQKIYMDANLKTIGGLMDGCIPLPLKLEQSKSCILCPLFVILFNTAQSMSVAAYDALAEGFKNLLLIGFALYVAYVTLKQVSSFTKQDAPKYITDLLTMSFKVLLAYLILANVSQLYSLVLEPLLSAAMEFGGAFLFRSSDNSNSFMSCTAATTIDGATLVSGFYSNSLFAKINCFVAAVQQELAVASSIGSSMMCVAQNEAQHWFGLPDMTMLISGALIWVFSWLVTLAFGFYLIDAVIRLGIIGGLMPFLIAAWPFKLTSGYTSKGWAMFLNTFFTFVFLGLVVSVNIELGMQSMTGGEGGAEKIIKLINKNDIKPLVELMSIGLAGLLFMILCCIFGFKLCAEATTLASQMSSYEGSTHGAKIASLGAGKAKWVAVKSGKAVLGGAELVGEGLGINDKVRAGKEAVGRRIYKGLNTVGARLGLRGTTPNPGSSNNTTGANRNRGNAENSRSSASTQGQNSPNDNKKTNGTNAAAEQNTPNQQQGTNGNEQTGEPTSRTAAGQTPHDGKGQAGSTGTSGNGTRTGSNNDKAENRGTMGAEEQNQDKNTGQEQKQDTNGHQEAGTPSDNGAGAAGPRQPDMKEKADAVVEDAKQKIAMAAENAARSGGQTGRGETVAGRTSGEKDKDSKKDKNSSREKELQRRLEEMNVRIASLAMQISELEKKQKAGGSTENVAYERSHVDEQMKKLKEEKAHLENMLKGQSTGNNESNKGQK